MTKGLRESGVFIDDLIGQVERLGCGARGLSGWVGELTHSHEREGRDGHKMLVSGEQLPDQIASDEREQEQERKERNESVCVRERNKQHGCIDLKARGRTQSPKPPKYTGEWQRRRGINGSIHFQRVENREMP